MRQLYYTIRYLLRGRGGNVIKVLSLTLGLGVGLILFARVAFELSFDTFFDQVEDLYSVHVRYNDDKTGEEDGSRILFAPIPEALRQEFPEIQYATVCRRRYGAVLYHGEDRFKPRLMMADSLFFRTMGIKVLGMTVCWESKIKFSYRKKWLNVYLARKIRSGNNCCTEKTILIRWPGYSVTYRKIVIYVLTLSLLSLI